MWEILLVFKIEVEVIGIVAGGWQVVVVVVPLVPGAPPPCDWWAR